MTRTEQIRKAMKKLRQNPEYVAKERVYWREWVKRNPEKRKAIVQRWYEKRKALLQN